MEYENFSIEKVGIETSYLLLKVLQSQSEWYLNTVRQDWPGGTHEDTRTIMFRGPATDDISLMHNCVPSQWCPIYDSPLGEEVEAVLWACIGDLPDDKEIGRVMVVALKSGGRIKPHIDEGDYAKEHTRYHLPLKSEEGNLFICEDEAVHMKVGELWTFNHQKVHEVINDSGSVRIHLIFDVRNISE